MSNILSKSPYIIEVTEYPILTGGKVEIFIWKQGTTEPTLPQYTLSKLTPASNSKSVFFDVAPYINEFITNKVCSINSSTLDVATDIELYTNVRIRKYKLVGSTYTAISSTYYYAFKGYGLNGINIDPSTFLLDQKTYYYHYDSSKTYDTLKAGDLTVFNKFRFGVNDYNYIYTNLSTGLSTTNSISSLEKWNNIYRVLPAYWSVGNKLEIYSISLDSIIATYYFKPIEECKYTPVTLDFINKYGAWQREFLFKNSTDSLNIESQSYKNYRTTPNVYSEQEALLTTFNTNGNESIKTNTGWVNEDFKDTIKQILLSDRILINNRPATITTKQLDLQKNINNKLINYSLDFNFSNPLI